MMRATSWPSISAATVILSICLCAFFPQTLAFSPAPKQTVTYRETSSVRPTRLFSSIQTEDTIQQITRKLSLELKELSECSGILYSYLSKSGQGVSVEDIVRACDKVDESAAEGE